MEKIIKLEEFALFALGIGAFYLTGTSWWWFWGLLLVPDIGMLGYLLSPKTGAWTYNIFHHRGIAVLVFGFGLFLPSQALEITGIILFSHSAMDRIFGYGLKYEKGFKFTHLGEIGKPH